MSEPNQPAIENQFGKQFGIICDNIKRFSHKNKKLFNVDAIKFYEIAKVHVKKTVFKFSSFDLGGGELVWWGGARKNRRHNYCVHEFARGLSVLNSGSY